MPPRQGPDVLGLGILGLDRVRLGGPENCVGGMEKNVLTSLVHPERGAQVAVNSTLGCCHLHTDVNHTVIL